MSSQNKRLDYTQVSDYALGIMPGLRTAEQEALAEVWHLAMDGCPEPLETVFISNPTREGDTGLEGAWFFSSNYVSEFLNFLAAEHPTAEICRFRGFVRWVRLSAEGFSLANPESSTPQSKLGVYLHTGAFVCDMVATGRNCTRLAEVYESHVKTSFVVPQAP